MVVVATKVFYSSSKSSNYSFVGRLAVLIKELWVSALNESLTEE